MNIILAFNPTSVKYTLLNIGWNAEPNAPMPELFVSGDSVTITFGLNYFLYPEFKEDDRGKLTFYRCYKYDFNGSNDEGYYLGQHRYNYKQLPWGGFYELESSWKSDFPENPVILSNLAN